MVYGEREPVRIPYRKKSSGDLVFQPHQHTTRSDGFGTPREIVDDALRAGINVLAITDHDTVSGAIEAWDYAEQYRLTNLTQDKGHFQVVIGEEVTTTEGHLLLLGIESSVLCGLSPEETAIAGVEQDALVVVPHPGFSQAEGLPWDETDRLSDLGLVHGVEIYNGAQQTLRHMAYIAEAFPFGDKIAKRLMPGKDINVEAIKHYLKTGKDRYAVLGGHDNHLPSGIDKVTTLFPKGMDVFDAVKHKQTVFTSDFIPEFWGPVMYLSQHALSRRLEDNRQNSRGGIMCVTVYER